MKMFLQNDDDMNLILTGPNGEILWTFYSFQDALFSCREWQVFYDIAEYSN